MPLNTLRLNHQPSSHPNERIVFIKPLPRPASQKDDYNRAELVLKAIAAQCLPIMKDQHLSVTTLEEHEPNPEFIGRNFNNGEIIQLVIQSKSGSWLPLNMIQMVMMHELAHNTHMNHGKGFWQTRNLYANAMRILWSKAYTGEGLWGHGRALGTLETAIGNNFVRSEELAGLPLCGGTFRSRRRKRKAKSEGSDLTWKEKRDKRIEKKFGKKGTALGEDEDKRLTLEISSKTKGSLGSKPRVAQSKRGRELRAAAALARFGTNKKEVAELENAEDDATETETETDYEDFDAAEGDARDRDGKKVLDDKGHAMVRVCEGEDHDDAELRNEMSELANLGSSTLSELEVRNEAPKLTQTFEQESEHPTPTSRKPRQDKTNTASFRPSENQEVQSDTDTRKFGQPLSTSSDLPLNNIDQSNIETPTNTAGSTAVAEGRNAVPVSDTSVTLCAICSMANDPLRATCLVCAHVQDVRKDPHHWRCAERNCNADYINAGDCGICGICGVRRARDQGQTDHSERFPSFPDGESGLITHI